MSTPRHRTAVGSSYFVTTKSWQGRCVFQVPETAQILVETLLHYRDENAYFLHEFVLMPDHLHLLITPGATTSVEKAIQLIKGGSSRRIHERTNRGTIIWQKGFYDWTVRDANDWNTKVQYIRMNPVRARLVDEPGDWPYSSANGRFVMDPVPRRYLNIPSGAEAPSNATVAAGLKPRPPEEISSEARILVVPAEEPGPKPRLPKEISPSVKAPTGGAQTVRLKPRPPEEISSEVRILVVPAEEPGSKPRLPKEISPSVKAPTGGVQTVRLKPRPPEEISSEARILAVPAEEPGPKPRLPEEISPSVKAPTGGAQTVRLKPRPPEENAQGSMAAGASSRFPDENGRDRAIVERAGRSDVHRENCK